MHNKDFHVLALVKGEHQFVYIFDEMGWDDLVETLCQQAEDPNLEFSWFDAALLSHRAKTQIESANETNTDVTETTSPDNETELDTNAPITSRLPR
ncbi:MAG: hypothetical protein JHD09_05610 [Gemmataceae bacterium]|nr:hypothetical protein [Gemmataceae bacterium]MBJ7429839.1 hypothetical protein [Gemmataceae bacterium]MBJ7494994.1 hypothetical protein [Gemmataceae bacterium]